MCYEVTMLALKKTSNYQRCEDRFFFQIHYCLSSVDIAAFVKKLARFTAKGVLKVLQYRHTISKTTAGLWRWKSGLGCECSVATEIAKQIASSYTGNRSADWYGEAQPRANWKEGKKKLPSGDWAAYQISGELLSNTESSCKITPLGNPTE